MRGTCMPILIFEVEGWFVMTDRWQAGSKLSDVKTQIYYQWGEGWTFGIVNVPFKKFTDLVRDRTNDDGVCDLRGNL